MIEFNDNIWGSGRDERSIQL